MMIMAEPTSNDGKPRCLLVRASYARSRFRAARKIALILATAAGVFGAAVAVVPTAVWSPWVIPAVICGELAVAFGITLPFFHLSAKRADRRLRELKDKDDLSFGEAAERAILEKVSAGSPNVPLSCAADAGLHLPDAVFVALIDHRRWPVLQSTDVPFEPLPLGEDPLRVRELLRAFAGLTFAEKEPTANPLRLIRRYREWLTTLSPTRRLLTTVIPTLVFIVIPILLALYLATGADPWLLSLAALPVIAAIVVRILISLFVHEARSTQCWLFPGIIGLGRGGGRRAEYSSLISRRGMGTLWYEVGVKRLSIPRGDGTYERIYCEPRDGLIAVWAWLNTAEPPEHIQLHDIA
jgi:hypothetical protein